MFKLPNYQKGVIVGLSESLIDHSNFTNNSWFTGFTEADGRDKIY
jgi:hypothetical protein